MGLPLREQAKIYETDHSWGPAVARCLRYWKLCCVCIAVRLAVCKLFGLNTTMKRGRK